jgi:linoleoyl-CoA desaturase
MLGLCVVMGFAMAGVGFSIGHDAQHGAYSSNPRINTLLGWTFELLGANGYMWRLTHNLIHHTYTQVHGVDEDIEVSPLLRLSPGSKHRIGHRFQYLYAPLAYSLSLLNWAFVKDFDYFSRFRLGTYEGRQHRRSDVAGLVVGKLFHYAFWLALPLYVLPLPWWQVVAGFVTVHLIGGFILGIVFQLAHVVEETSYPLPGVEDGKMENPWAEHQMRTTANFCRDNRFVCWYVGGLNFQIEHHLFPKTCSVHYRAISSIVRTVAREHDLPYHENVTFTGAIRSHWRMLRRLGAGEQFPPRRQLADAA